MPTLQSTTVRASRRTHQALTELAERKHMSATDLLEQLVEAARRREMLRQYNTRMAEVLSDTAERAEWSRDTEWSETSAAELTAGDAASLAR